MKTFTMQYALRLECILVTNTVNARSLWGLTTKEKLQVAPMHAGSGMNESIKSGFKGCQYTFSNLLNIWMLHFDPPAVEYLDAARSSLVGTCGAHVNVQGNFIEIDGQLLSKPRYARKRKCFCRDIAAEKGSSSWSSFQTGWWIGVFEMVAF